MATELEMFKKIDPRQHGQLQFLLGLIRQQERKNWKQLLNDYVLFPLLNPTNATAHQQMVDAFLANVGWQQWIFPLFERGSIDSLLFKGEMAEAFRCELDQLIRNENS